MKFPVKKISISSAGGLGRPVEEKRRGKTHLEKRSCRFEGGVSASFYTQILLLELRCLQMNVHILMNDQMMTSHSGISRIFTTFFNLLNKHIKIGRLLAK